ncbi:hypothetical protein [Kitasatospora sp. NPDC086791]|uniref:hypothetical protein n=1 Tax=Kitasatospora sp. NPDC086791 TaxID=3155178 RepID=UPI00341494AB
MIVCSFVPLRLELLVIPPPEAEASAAEWLMAAASDPANTRTGTDLLTAAGAPTADPRADG